MERRQGPRSIRCMDLQTGPGGGSQKTSNIQAKSPVDRDMQEHVKCISTKRNSKIGDRETEARKREKVERYLLH